jgi:protease IV
MKRGEKKIKTKPILLTLAATLIVIFIILPLSFISFDGANIGNVALIKVEGMITSNGAKYLGSSTTSSQTIVNFVEEAEQNKQIEAIVIEINSPGGTPVASEEIATAIKKSSKPTIALIREVGASGGYWVASACDLIVANKMSITGSIGVMSSYLEFSGLMEKYGVGYERIVAGKYKDLGVPFKKLNEEEHNIIVNKANTIHDIFITEIVNNRNMEEKRVRELATGEYYLGIEALETGLIDILGDKNTVEQILKEDYNIEKLDYIIYNKPLSFFEMLSGVLTDASFNVGEGIGSMLIKKSSNLMLI